MIPTFCLSCLFSGRAAGRRFDSDRQPCLPLSSRVRIPYAQMSESEGNKGHAPVLVAVEEAEEEGVGEAAATDRR